MPNGGSDCCGTCPFNAKNKGESGLAHARDPEPDFCLIRQLAIPIAFWTYCANHPYHNKALVELPVGPVYRAVSTPAAGSYGREIWVESPDTEAIRQFLLHQLQQIPEQPPANEYPSPASWEHVVIWQLGAFGEQRAVADLRRISAFDPQATNPADKLKHTRALTVQLAKEALTKIEGGSETSP